MKINYENKTQVLSYNKAKFNAQDANEIKDSVNELYDKKADIENIPTKTSQLINDSGFLTSEVEFNNSVAKIITNEDLINLKNQSGINTGDQDLSEYALKSDIPESYTDEQARQTVSQVGYLTSETDPIYNADKPNLALKSELNGLASETYVNQKVADIVNSAPETLNTLNELSLALGNDPNFATTTLNLIGIKAVNTEVIHNTGDEDISGIKTFNDGLITKGLIQPYYIDTTKLISGSGWTKIAEIELTAQYQSADISADIHFYNNTISTGNRFCLSVFAQQNLALGNDPAFWGTISDANFVFDGSRITMVVSEKSATRSVVQVYLRYANINEYFKIYPRKLVGTYNSAKFLGSQPIVANYPAGTAKLTDGEQLMGQILRIFGKIAINWDGTVFTNTVNEKDVNSGVNVDGLLIKDGKADGVDISDFKADYDSHVTSNNTVTNTLTTSITDLDGRAVHKTGDETVAGVKTFSNKILFKDCINIGSVESNYQFSVKDSVNSFMFDVGIYNQNPALILGNSYYSSACIQTGEGGLGLYNQSGYPFTIYKTPKNSIYGTNPYVGSSKVFIIDTSDIVHFNKLYELTNDAGVTVEDVLLKDGLIDGVDVSTFKTDYDTFKTSTNSAITNKANSVDVYTKTEVDNKISAIPSGGSGTSSSVMIVPITLTGIANGVNTVFNLDRVCAQIDLRVNGLYFSTNDYTLNGTVLTFNEAPPAGSEIIAYQLDIPTGLISQTVSFTGLVNGTNTVFTLSKSCLAIDLRIDGICFSPSDYTLNGTTLTLNEAPLSGAEIIIYELISYNESNLVHKSGTETVAGVKTFSDGIIGTVNSINILDFKSDYDAYKNKTLEIATFTLSANQTTNLASGNWVQFDTKQAISGTGLTLSNGIVTVPKGKLYAVAYSISPTISNSGGSLNAGLCNYADGSILLKETNCVPPISTLTVAGVSTIYGILDLRSATSDMQVYYKFRVNSLVDNIRLSNTYLTIMELKV